MLKNPGFELKGGTASNIYPHPVLKYLAILYDENLLQIWNYEVVECVQIIDLKYLGQKNNDNIVQDFLFVDSAADAYKLHSGQDCVSQFSTKKYQNSLDEPHFVVLANTQYLQIYDMLLDVENRIEIHQIGSTVTRLCLLSSRNFIAGTETGDLIIIDADSCAIVSRISSVVLLPILDIQLLSSSISTGMYTLVRDESEAIYCLNIREGKLAYKFAASQKGEVIQG